MLRVFNVRHARQAQSGSQAALVVVIIAAVIILYILALPPDVRQWLLTNGSNYSTPGPGQGQGLEVSNLLDESPGLLTVQASSFKSLMIPSFSLKITTEGSVLSQLPNILVLHGVFTNKQYSFPFKIENPSLVSNVRLSFNVNKASGRLVIFLNGQEIFNAKLSKGSPKPILLPKNSLRSNNELLFTVSSPGLAFWRVNTYELENVLITATVTDVSSSESSQQVVLGDEDVQNLDRVEVSGIVECSQAKGLLTILVNDVLVFKALPDCGSVMHLAVDPSTLRKGVNVLTFKSEQDYAFDNLRLKLYFSKPLHPTYYFNIDDAYFETSASGEQVLKPGFAVKLFLDFPDPDARKQLEVSINGRKFVVDTFNAEFERDVSSYVFSGVNSVKLKPLRNVEVSRLKIVLQRSQS
ncbi:hypothetical protein J7L02_03095 [Candidatus Woesearchaeota archaeon]|nr:hypothetical protein [Candidatus Woesearchaeota archaeon]